MTELKITPTKPCSETTKYLVLLGLVAILLGFGFVLCPSVPRLLTGIEKIITHPALIDFDAFFWGEEFGATFVQAGLSSLIVILVYWLTKTNIQGVHIAMFMMVFGFSFYGKTIINMWFPVIGVFLYAKLYGKKLADVTALAFGVACIAPIFSTLAFYTQRLGIGSSKAIIVAAIVGVLAGFLSGFFADYFPVLHKGLLLYNAGMAAGWVAIMLNSILKTTGFGHDAYPYNDLSAYITDRNSFFVVFMFVVFAYLIVCGLILGGSSNLLNLFTYKSPGGNHVEKFGIGACLVNMGLVGILSVGYVLLVGADINGTTFCGIFAVVGFIAHGSTPRTHLPILLGVAIGAFLTGGITGMAMGESFLTAGMAKVATRGMVLSALFASGVAPITGNYGILAGFLVGMVHSVVVPNVPPLHGWMSLYNNGFSLGLVTTLLYPIYSKLNFGKKASDIS